MRNKMPSPQTPGALAYLQGREAGQREGYEEGYFRGKQQAYTQRSHFTPAMRDVHVLYVASGKGYPYSPIDEAVFATLQSMVRQVTLSDSRADVASAAAGCRPDVMIVLDGMFLPTDQVDQVRSMGIPTAVWMTDDPYYADMSAGWVMHYDYVFTLEKNCVAYYQNLGCPRVAYLPFAAYPGHYRPIPKPTAFRRQVSFIGTAYPKRIEFFSPIMEELMKFDMHINGNWWERLPGYSRYGTRIEMNKWMGPAETADVYNSAKIVVNLHRAFDDAAINQNTSRIQAASPNPRTFEIGACGTLQLCDEREDLASFYTPGVEMDTFRSPAELLEKIAYYVANEPLRKEIALRGLERTLKEHTYAHRLERMLSVIFA
ncbi:glycosyltransferase [Paenibacillus sp. F411]|uniref:CgeB family protein n=1 Tax=Paenibacillus sp. F411 TaxID=2820239 RepID=UPI001AAFFBED|nr:glycosyltransferase [Paenibacillus sp. F411]MBO2943993.1 glycosyltransferase [Paenibacillus sp. F411]